MVKVGIDIGHGSNTFPPSKGVYRGGKGHAEHNFNSKVAQKLDRKLKANGIETYMAQQPYKPDVALQTRRTRYINQKVDIVVSIHADANNNSGAKGRYYFYWNTSNNGKRLATLIRDEVRAKGYGLRGDGLQPSYNNHWTQLFIVKNLPMVSVLGENGFMTNASDFELIFGSKQEQYTEDIADAYARGICRYFGRVYKSVGGAATTARASTSSNSTSIAGARLVKNENAFFLATENIKVRSAPSTSARHTGTLPKGTSINYFRVFEGNGHRWLEYRGNSGNLLYLPYRESGSGKKQWGTFHSTRPNDASAPKRKTVDQMAREVIDGKHGTGHQNRRKSLGISQAEYEKVRRRVNQLAK